MTRVSNRQFNQLRKLSMEANINENADGSCLIFFGKTQVLCCATIEEKVPPFLKGKNKGWITAEYGMLPCATANRVEREAVKGKQSSRTQEIQRLIGRSIRSIVDLPKLGERQIKLDCDVIRADGGTRTAAISGSYVALYLAINKLLKQGIIAENPIKTGVAAVSVGIVDNKAVLDLDYKEDSNAQTDANFVIAGNGNIIEIQATAEQESFTEEQLLEMLKLAKIGTQQIAELQLAVIKQNQ